MKENVEEIVRNLVDKETKAWNEKDAESLVSLFHRDMVWPWPKDNKSHNPVNWIMSYGRYDRQKWTNNWNKLFDEYELVHNRRKIVKVVVTDELDGAFAVVDIDTCWRDKNGKEDIWKGRVCKVFTKVGDDWKIITHTGVLEYD